MVNYFTISLRPFTRLSPNVTPRMGISRPCPSTSESPLLSQWPDCLVYPVSPPSRPIRFLSHSHPVQYIVDSQVTRLDQSGPLFKPINASGATTIYAARRHYACRTASGRCLQTVTSRLLRRCGCGCLASGQATGDGGGGDIYGERAQLILGNDR